MGLNSIKGREWHIQNTCAITGDGIYEVLDFFEKTVKRSTWWYRFDLQIDWRLLFIVGKPPLIFYLLLLVLFIIIIYEQSLYKNQDCT